MSPLKIKLLPLASLQGAHMDERDHSFVRRLLVLPPHHRLCAEDRTGLPLQFCHQDRPQRHQVQ